MRSLAPVAILAAIACCNAQTAADFSPAGACVANALVTGAATLANPPVAALELLAACGGVTASGLASMLEQLLQGDAGTNPALASVLIEVRKLPPSYTKADALKALKK